MKLCTFELTGSFGPLRRIGALTPAGKIVDLNLAYRLTLAERDNHPRARELSDVIELEVEGLGTLRNRFVRKEA